MRAGRLRHRITLQSPADGSPNARGEYSQTWTGQGDVWASVEPMSGSEKQESDKAVIDISHKITIRRRSAVDATWRALFDGRALYFVSALRPDERAISVEIMAQERAP